MSVDEHIRSLLLEIYLQIEMLGHKVGMHLISFSRYCQAIYQYVYISIHSH